MKRLKLDVVDENTPLDSISFTFSQTFWLIFSSDEALLPKKSVFWVNSYIGPFTLMQSLCRWTGRHQVTNTCCLPINNVLSNMSDRFYFEMGRMSTAQHCDRGKWIISDGNSTVEWFANLFEGGWVNCSRAFLWKLKLIVNAFASLSLTIVTVNI